MRVMVYSVDDDYYTITGAYLDRYLSVRAFIAVLGIMPILLAWDLPITFFFYRYYSKYMSILDNQKKEYLDTNNDYS